MIEVKLGNVKYDFQKMESDGLAEVLDVYVSDFFEDIDEEEIADEEDDEETAGGDIADEDAADEDAADIDIKAAYVAKKLAQKGVILPKAFQAGKLFDNKIQVFTHMRMPNRDKENDGWIYGNTDIMLVVTGEDCDKISHVKVGNQYYQKFEGAENTTYFIPPRYWEKTEQGTFACKDVASHYTNPGVEHIHICYKEGMKDDVLILTSIASMDAGKENCEQQDYIAMINDLCAIHEDLIRSDSNMSLDEGWLLKLEKKVNAVARAWKKLEDNLECKLEPEYVKMPIRKLKHMTPKSMIEYTTTGSDMVHGVSYTEDYDIYENQIIKSYIVKLQNQIKIKKKMCENGLARKQATYKSYLQEVEDGNDNDVAAILKKGKLRLVKKIDKTPLGIRFVEYEEAYFKGENLSQVTNKKRETVTVKFDMRIFKGDYASTIYTDVVEYYYLLLGTVENNIGSTQKILIDVRNTELVAAIYYALKIENVSKIDCGKLEITGFFCNNTSVSPIHAPSNTKILVEKPESIKLVKDDGSKSDILIAYGNHKNEFFKIFKKTFYRYAAQKVNPAITGDRFTAIYSKILKAELIEKAEEKSDYRKENIDKLSELEKRIQKILSAKCLKDIKLTKKKIQRTNIFAGNTAYATFYQLIMKERKENREEDNTLYEFDDQLAVNVEKVERIYERWCLIKLLSLMVVDYGFSIDIQDDEIKRAETPQKKLALYIEKQMESKEDSLQKEMTFVLERTWKDHFQEYIGNRWEYKETNNRKLKITVYYQHPFCFAGEWKEGVLPKSIKSKEKLIPDIFMKWEMSGDLEPSVKELNHNLSTITKYFCLDAKYRTKNNFTGENGKSRWFSDICSVALQKYIIELEQGPRVKDEAQDYSIVRQWDENGNQLGTNFAFHIDGSFVMHSNSECFFKGLNAKGYYGNLPNEFLDNAKNLYEKPGMKEQRDKEVSAQVFEFGSKTHLGHRSPNTRNQKDWNATFTEYENDNRIGAFLLLPSQDNYLRAFFAMVMEYHFRIYHFLCWTCGTQYEKDDVTGSPIKREDDSVKYTYSCSHCGETHQRNYCNGYGGACLRPIGKWRINYYQSDSNPMNLKCPHCHKEGTISYS